MALPSKLIFNNALHILRKRDISTRNCYVGITGNVNRRLREHCVSYSPAWYWRAPTPAVARATEQALLRTGMDGGGGGNPFAQYVYVYVKGIGTSP